MKISVHNLAYDLPEDLEIHQLDGMEGTFPQLIKAIKTAIGKGKNEVSGYRIVERNYEDTGEEFMPIIITEDHERCINITNYGHGGKRSKAGRPTIGKEKRIKKYIFATPDEHEKIKKYLVELREDNENGTISN